MKTTSYLITQFADIREVAVEKEITATDAVRAVMAANPDATRIEIKHAAMTVGINKFTARNAFDKFHSTK